MTRRKVSPEIYALSTIMFAAIPDGDPGVQRGGGPPPTGGDLTAQQQAQM